MRRYFLFCLLFTPFFFSCNTDEPKKLTKEVMDVEKEEVIKTLDEYNTAFETKNFSKMVPTLSKDVIFFGTDSADVIKSLSEFKDVLEKQWGTFDTMKYGKMSDVTVQMDDKATLASVIYGTPCYIVHDGNKENLFLRVARTLKKEGNKWTIVSGIVSIARTGNSSIETMNMPKDTTQAKKK